MKCPNCYNDVRDQAKFCPHCGHKLSGSQKTQLVQPPAGQPAAPPPRPAAPPPPPPPAAYRPPVYTPPPGAVPPPGVPPQPFSQPGVPPAATPPPRRLQRPAWPVLAGVAVALLLGLAALWFFFLRGGGRAVGVPQGDRALVAIGDSPTILGESLGALSRDGDWSEIAFDRDGLFVFIDANDGYTNVAPNGRLLNVHRYNNDGTLQAGLVAIDGGTELHSEEGILWASGSRAFAADSGATAYTRWEDDQDGERFTLVVVDADGELLGEWPDLVFTGFFAGGNRLLALRLDDEGLIDDLVTVSLPDGQPERLVSLAESSDTVAPFIYDDYVYYRQDGELRRVDAAGQNATTIFRFDSDEPAVFALPGLDNLLVLERTDSSVYGDLYAVAPDGSDRVRLDEAVYVEPGDAGSGGVAFAAARGRLAYTTVDDDLLTLNLINADGSDRRRLIDDQMWLVFNFSPDGRRLAYIAGEAEEEGGALYVVELPDGDPVRLSRDAWSLLFAGDRLLFSTVEGADGDDPESVVRSVTPAGEDEEVIFGPEDGFIRLISPVR